MVDNPEDLLREIETLVFSENAVTLSDYCKTILQIISEKISPILG